MIKVEIEDFDNETRLVITLEDGKILSRNKNGDFKIGNNKKKLLGKISENKFNEMLKNSKVDLKLIELFSKKMVKIPKTPKEFYEKNNECLTKKYLMSRQEVLKTGVQSMLLNDKGLLTLNLIDGRKIKLNRDDSKEILYSINRDHKEETKNLIKLNFKSQKTVSYQMVLERFEELKNTTNPVGVSFEDFMKTIKTEEINPEIKVAIRSIFREIDEGLSGEKLVDVVDEKIRKLKGLSRR